MATPKQAKVRASHNFLSNLDTIAEFLLEIEPHEASARFDTLRREIDELIGLLEAHPAIGRPARFLASRSIQARERASRVGRLAQSLGMQELREYVLKDYVVLYANSSSEVVLLALKHQRQLQYRI